MNTSTKQTENLAECGNKSKPLLSSRLFKFRAWDEKQKYMAIQGTPDLETLQSFMFHFGDCFLMQFTELRDKNGLEIYEGDILKKGNGKKEVVTFRNGSFHHGCGTHLTTIIGNIFENPELL